MGRAQSHHFSVGVTIIIESRPVIKSNNLLSYGIKVTLWSTKLKLIKLLSYSQKLKFHMCKRMFLVEHNVQNGAIYCTCFLRRICVKYECNLRKTKLLCFIMF